MPQPPLSLVLPTAWLPSVEYFALLLSGASILIEVHESYPKQTCRNRCYVATSNKVMPLSVPVVKTYGNHTLTRDITLAMAEPWQRNHWRTIESAYRNAAWFIHYEAAFRQTFFQPYSTLVDMNSALILKLAGLMKVEVAFDFTTDWKAFYGNALDLRASFNEQEPIEGFSQVMFKPYFQCFADRYGFQPNLSIIDLLFNCGPESVSYLRNLGAGLLSKLSL